MPELRPVGGAPALDLKSVYLHARGEEAVFLTYTFDLPFFEAYVLPTLVRNGCRSVTVAACGRWLADELPEWIESGDVREAGRSYTLSGVTVPTVFHPKLALMAKENQGTVLAGSGNISTFGMATGGELFTWTDWTGTAPPPLAREVWQLCRSAADALTVEPMFGERVEAMGRLVPMLAAPVPNEDRTLLHNLEAPILDQFLAFLGVDDPVDELLVWSPFTDQHLDALATLVERVAPSSITLAVQPGLTGIDGAELQALMAKHSATSWYLRELRMSDSLSPHLIHAKGILAVLRSGQRLLLAGSPNLSAPALLRTANQANFEVGTLHRGPDLDQMLFGEGAAVVLGGQVDPAALLWRPDPTTEETTGLPIGPSLVLLGARTERSLVILDVQGKMPDDAVLLLDGTPVERPVRVGDSWQVGINSSQSPRVAELRWEGHRAGPVIVADVDRLAAMRRVGAEDRGTIPLDAIDYGDDSDILQLLDQLAQLAVISAHDLERLVRGKAGLSDREEADVAQGTGPVVDLSDIDFDKIQQHPRGRAYASDLRNTFEAPRIQLWLDEIVRQFNALRDRQIRPVESDEMQRDEELSPADDELQRRRWSISQRVAVRVRNRLWRYVLGVGDARFRELVGHEWMAKNYVLFSSLIERLWTRCAYPSTAILGEEDLAKLTSALFAGFWGDDRTVGYWQKLDASDRDSDALLLVDYHADALTAALCIRLLACAGAVGREATFTVAGFVRSAETSGLLSTEVVERALLFLDRLDETPESHLARLQATIGYFSWDRFCENLAHRYGVRSVRLATEAPGFGRFTSGPTLVVRSDGSVLRHPSTLALFGAWIQESRAREPGRKMYQMAWGDRTILFYDVTDGDLLIRRSTPEGGNKPYQIATGVKPDEVGSLSTASLRRDREIA